MKEIILERNPEAIFLNAMFNKALAGTAMLREKKYVAVYDGDKCIEIIMEELKMGELEAFEQLEKMVEELSCSTKNNPIIFNDFRNVKSTGLTDTNGYVIKDIISNSFKSK